MGVSSRTTIEQYQVERDIPEGEIGWRSTSSAGYFRIWVGSSAWTKDGEQEINWITAHSNPSFLYLKPLKRGGWIIMGLGPLSSWPELSVERVWLLQFRSNVLGIWTVFVCIGSSQQLSSSTESSILWFPLKRQSYKVALGERGRSSLASRLLFLKSRTCRSRYWRKFTSSNLKPYSNRIANWKSLAKYERHDIRSSFLPTVDEIKAAMSIEITFAKLIFWLLRKVDER